MDKEQEELGFKKGNEYEPNDLALMTTNFQSFYLWLFDTAKNNAPKDNGIVIKASIGPVSAEIVYTPVQTLPSFPAERIMESPTYSKPASGDAIVSEYPDLLTWDAAAGFVGTKKKLGDDYNAINEKLKAIGYQYVKWVKGDKHTGGWMKK